MHHAVAAVAGLHVGCHASLTQVARSAVILQAGVQDGWL